MADSKITDLTPKATGAATDEFVINDVAGGNADKKLAMSAIRITESQITDLGTYLTDITGENLSDLADVTITSIASGELLKWNGSAWINNTLAEAGIAATSHTHTESDITDLQSYLTDATGSALADGTIWLGNGSNVAAEVTLSGDVTVSNAGVTAIGSGVIVNADINASAGIELSKTEITGTPDGTKFLRDDATWQAIPGGGDALTSNPLSQFAATTSAQLAGVISDETGSGSLVFATSPTFTTKITTDPVFINESAAASVDVAGDGQFWVKNDTPNIPMYTNDAGTDYEIITDADTQTLTNKTIDGDNNTISNLAHGAEVDNPSSGVHGVTGSVVGTSDSQTLTNKTINTASNTITIVEADISDLGSYLTDVVNDSTPQLGADLECQGNNIQEAGVIFLKEQAEADADVAGEGQIWVDTATPNVLMFTDDAGTDFTIANTAMKLDSFAATTSAELAGTISDETGSGALVFATSPTLVTPVLGTPTSGTLTNCTGLPIATGLASGTKANLESVLSDVSDIAEADGDTYTGAHDFGGADSLELPNSATPTVNATGEIALDTSITDHTPLLRYYSGTEEMLVIAIPNDQLTATDGHVIAYNATDNEFEMVAGGGGGSVTDNYTIPLTMEVPEGTVAYPDIHTLATASGKVSGMVLPDGASSSTINFKGVVPKNLAGTPAMAIRVRIMTMGAVAGPADVRLTVKTIGVADTEALDQALTAETETTVTMPTATETMDYYEQDLTTDWAASDTIIGQISRDPTDAADDFTDDILIVGVDLVVDRTLS